jgi:hypothetical protein
LTKEATFKNIDFCDWSGGACLCLLPLKIKVGVFIGTKKIIFFQMKLLDGDKHYIKIIVELNETEKLCT